MVQVVLVLCDMDSNGFPSVLDFTIFGSAHRIKISA